MEISTNRIDTTGFITDEDLIVEARNKFHRNILIDKNLQIYSESSPVSEHLELLLGIEILIFRDFSSP